MYSVKCLLVIAAFVSFGSLDAYRSEVAATREDGQNGMDELFGHLQNLQQVIVDDDDVEDTTEPLQRPVRNALPKNLFKGAFNAYPNAVVETREGGQTDMDELFGNLRNLQQVKVDGDVVESSVEQPQRPVGGFIMRLVIKIVKKMIESRECLFEPLVSSVKIGDQWLMGLFSIWENYRREHLPMFKRPSEIIKAIFAGNVSIVKVKRAIFAGISQTVKAAKLFIPEVRNFLKCVREQKSRPYKNI